MATLANFPMVSQWLQQSTPFRPLVRQLSTFLQIAGWARQYNIRRWVIATTTSDRGTVLNVILIKFVMAVVALAFLSLEYSLNIGIGIVTLCTLSAIATVTYSHSRVFLTILSLIPILPTLSKNFRVLFSKLAVFLKSIFPVCLIPLLMVCKALLSINLIPLLFSCSCFYLLFRLSPVSICPSVSTRFAIRGEPTTSSRTFVEKLSSRREETFTIEALSLGYNGIHSKACSLLSRPRMFAASRGQNILPLYYTINLLRRLVYDYSS